jgi:hypothetical protein
VCYLLARPLVFELAVEPYQYTSDGSCEPPSESPRCGQLCALPAAGACPQAERAAATGPRAATKHPRLTLATLAAPRGEAAGDGDDADEAAEGRVLRKSWGAHRSLAG